MVKLKELTNADRQERYRKFIKLPAILILIFVASYMPHILIFNLILVSFIFIDLIFYNFSLDVKKYNNKKLIFNLVFLILLSLVVSFFVSPFLMSLVENTFEIQKKSLYIVNTLISGITIYGVWFFKNKRKESC